MQMLRDVHMAGLPHVSDITPWPSLFWNSEQLDNGGRTRTKQAASDLSMEASVYIMHINLDQAWGQ